MAAAGPKRAWRRAFLMIYVDAESGQRLSSAATTERHGSDRRSDGNGRSEAAHIGDRLPADTYNDTKAERPGAADGARSTSKTSGTSRNGDDDPRRQQGGDDGGNDVEYGL